MGNKNIQHTVRYAEIAFASHRKERIIPNTIDVSVLTRRCLMGQIRRNTAKIATVTEARSRKRATDEERA
jgi:hypothetical protein